VRLHYVDEGTGEPVVMLHGNPTWGYVYRNFVAPLSANRRCVVPDHVGFGRSDKPLDLVIYQWTDFCPHAEVHRIESAGHFCRRTSRIGSWR
jgi:pimeloyl-ACP methyl ester carboxylesterase